MSDRAVFLAAGEQSGDLHGAELARELRRRLPGIRLYGLGGSRMRSAGVELLADLDRLAILGFTEIVRHLPDLARLKRSVRSFLLERQVDLVVPIDYPGFNLPLARWCRRQGIRVVYYIAPQVWAWHESRARRLAEDADLVCVVLPFEAERLRRWGVRAEFVGHPLLDGAAVERRRNADGARVLGVFPGSREQEVRRLLPVFLAGARRLRSELPDLDVRVARTRDLPRSTYDGHSDARLVDVSDALAHADAAITKSGTITLQLALAGIPMAVGYRVSPLTFTIASRLVRVEHIALVNLVAGRTVVPELIQGRLTAERLERRLLPLLEPGSDERAEQLRGLSEVAARLGTPGAAGRVAEHCVRVLESGAGAG